MKGGLFRPDGFAVGLVAFGIVLLFVPMMLMPGVGAMGAAVVYWLTMIVVKWFYRLRN